ncbi:hypothetical protein GECvBGOT_gp193 [Salmonella phage GEC_vB_GOT]|nr:hypothetical protein GECvBGOT_gp193 [Salmonella phage GEC_vB_GOT]
MIPNDALIAVNSEAVYQSGAVSRACIPSITALMKSPL